MYDSRKSDGCIVPKKSPNNKQKEFCFAEEAEKRRPAKGNPGEQNRLRDRTGGSAKCAGPDTTGSREGQGLGFTTLWHHVYRISTLRVMFYRLGRRTH